MRVCENKSIQGLERWGHGPGIADARKPSVLIELWVRHLAHRAVSRRRYCQSRPDRETSRKRKIHGLPRRRAGLQFNVPKDIFGAAVENEGPPWLALPALTLAGALRDSETNSVSEGRMPHKDREKRNEYSRRWRAKNAEKARESERKWRAANPEKAEEGRRRWRAANPEKQRETDRKWRAANPERVKQNRRKSRAANAERIREERRRAPAAATAEETS
jgi:hypothetical protein